MMLDLAPRMLDEIADCEKLLQRLSDPAKKRLIEECRWGLTLMFSACMTSDERLASRITDTAEQIIRRAIGEARAMPGVAAALADRMAARLES